MVWLRATIWYFCFYILILHHRKVRISKILQWIRDKFSSIHYSLHLCHFGDLLYTYPVIIFLPGVSFCRGWCHPHKGLRFSKLLSIDFIRLLLLLAFFHLAFLSLDCLSNNWWLRALLVMRFAWMGKGLKKTNYKIMQNIDLLQWEHWRNISH